MVTASELIEELQAMGSIEAEVVESKAHADEARG